MLARICAVVQIRKIEEKCRVDVDRSKRSNGRIKLMSVAMIVIRLSRNLSNITSTDTLVALLACERAFALACSKH